MKKIFVAASLVLAIVGAVAAKANTKQLTYYYLNGSNVCTSITFTADPCTGTAFDCTSTIGGVDKTLYTESSCSTIAKRN